MARRMFNDQIVRSDSFLNMPTSTRELYFQLNMDGDDDGFVKNPFSVMRIVGASKNDMDLLIAKKYIIVFENGVIVIKHWRMHNYIRNDRYKPTVYQNELAMLDLKENKAYKLKEIPYDLFSEEVQQNDDGRQLVDQRFTQYKLSKDKLSKVNKEDNTEEITSKSSNKSSKKKFVPPTLKDVEEYCKQRKNSVDPKKFFDYFNVAGWVDSNGKQVKNWKQKIITWESHSNNKEGNNGELKKSSKKYIPRRQRVSEELD